MRTHSGASKGQRTTPALRRANRALHLHAALFREIAQAEDEQTLLERVCQMAVRGGYTCAWIGRAEHDELQTVRFVAGAGEAAHEVPSLDIRWSDTPTGNGATGRAIRTGEPAVYASKPTGPALAAWSALVARRGLAVAASLPLFVDGEIFGALTVYSSELTAFDPAEVAALNEFAFGVALAMSEIRARASRRRIERSIAKSEARLADVLARVQDVVYAYDAYQERFFYISPSVERVFGRPPTRYQAGHFVDDVHPDDRPAIAAARARLLEGEQVDQEFRIVRPDGEVRWLRHRASGLVGCHGAIDRIDGIFTDVTDRRRAEDALRQSEEQLRQLADNMEEGLFIIDVAKLAIVYASARLYALRGWSAAEGLGASIDEWLAVVVPEDAASMRAALMRCLAGEPTEFSARIHHRDGTTRHIRGRGSPVRGAQGELLRVVGVVRDVTVELAAEEEARSARELIEQRVVERTAALAAANADLLRARDERSPR